MSFHKALGAPISSPTLVNTTYTPSVEEPTIPGQVKITVNSTLCKGCGICIMFCPARILEADTPTAWGGYSPRICKGGETKCMLVRGEHGVKCRLCEKRCPDAAIMVEVGEE